MQVKLLRTQDQAKSLLVAMEWFNIVCDAIAEVAHARRCANKLELQKLVYHNTRDRFGLSAQMTIRAISKVVEVYKWDRDIKPRFRPHGAIAYDQRILLWKGPDRVSILTLEGRAVMPQVAGAYQKACLAFPRGQADLIHRDGRFFLFVTMGVGDVPLDDPEGYLGVHLAEGEEAAQPMTSLPGCLWYGTPVKRAGKTFCSKTCTSRHRGEARGALRKQLNCEQCGGVFETWLHLEGTQRFCGKACEVEADHATLVARTGDLHPRFTANWHTCEECGRRFHRPASRAEAGTRFCSIACRRAAKSATVACAQCSDEFRVDRHREEDARFCSSSAKQTSGGLRTF